VVKLFKALRKSSVVLSSVVLALTVAACGQAATNSGSSTSPAASSSPSTAASASAAPTSAAKLAGDIKIDGSSTVFPISQAIAEEFMKTNKEVRVTVGESGSSNGLKKLIGGEIDIADSSRKIKEQEVTDLKAKSLEAIEMPIAYDGITVVVNKKNTFAKDITVAELKKIWEKDSKVKLWSEVRAGWPEKEIKLFGPGSASGTFEYFTEAINGKAKEGRSDYTPSEDDNVLVKGVAGDEFAMGYFGFSYYEENKATLTALSIKKDDASPAVAPTYETIKDLSYKPLARPIYIYPLKSAIAKPEVKEFLKFYNSAEGQKLVEAVKYIKLQPEMYAKNLEALK
jgi:phosphate transport system substrate-binding protein